MTESQLLTTILLPAIISIGVAWANNQRQKSLEFKYDYRKYILDKRKEAYDKIAEFMDELLTHSIDTYNPELESKTLNIWVGSKTYFWASNNMVDKIFEFYNLIEGMNKAKLADEEGEFMNRYMQLMYQFQQIFFDDLAELDNIEKFRDEKKTRNIERIRDFKPR